MELLINTMLVIMIFVAFFLGFEFGKFKGAKDGIDYCFEQRMREQLSKEESNGNN